jgi:hypothetical protein
MKTIQTFLICIIFGAGNLFAASGTRPDLTGRVLDANGAPVSKATAFIYSAGPKIGTSSMCPYCYADCAKKAQTDADGHFTIKSLDPTLIFHVMIVAAGHESKIVSKVDPAKDQPSITVVPLSPEDLNSPLRIRGMVVDEDGKPVPEAVISPQGIGMGPGTQWGGIEPYVEPMAVADDHGQFVLFCKSNNVDAVYATVDGRGLAQQWDTLKPGGDYLLRMQDGVKLTGQVLRDGKPLKDVSIGAMTKDRTCGVYFNCAAISTDSSGHFQLLNVPPDRVFVVYATMKSLQLDGALPDKIITIVHSVAVQDLGKLEVQPGFIISGRIVLSDGKPIPPDTRLYLGRQGAADSVETKLTADGRFEVKDVPGESVSLAVRIKGYRLSKRNPSLDWLNGQILGRVTGDVSNLTILMEPGNWQFNQQDNRPDGVEAYPIDQPLRGVEL